MGTSSKAIPVEKVAIIPVQEPRKIYKKGGFSMRTGLTKKQKVTEVFYNAKDPTAEVYTHDTKLKKRCLNTQPNSRNCANRPTMMSTAACGSRLTKVGSVSD